MSRTYLAITTCLLGEVELAPDVIEEAVTHAIETSHVPKLVNTNWFRALFEMIRGDAAAARRDADVVIRLSQENALSLYAAGGALTSAWANARLEGGATGLTELRQALAAYIGQANSLASFLQGSVAENQS